MFFARSQAVKAESNHLENAVGDRDFLGSVEDKNQSTFLHPFRWEWRW